MSAKLIIIVVIITNLLPGQFFDTPLTLTRTFPHPSLFPLAPPTNQENELIQDEIKKLQGELLHLYRDKESLLERLVQYEGVESQMDVDIQTVHHTAGPAMNPQDQYNFDIYETHNTQMEHLHAPQQQGPGQVPSQFNISKQQADKQHVPQQATVVEQCDGIAVVINDNSNSNQRNEDTKKSVELTKKPAAKPKAAVKPKAPPKSKAPPKPRAPAKNRAKATPKSTMNSESKDESGPPVKQTVPRIRKKPQPKQQQQKQEPQSQVILPQPDLIAHHIYQPQPPSQNEQMIQGHIQIQPAQHITSHQHNIQVTNTIGMEPFHQLQNQQTIVLENHNVHQSTHTIVTTDNSACVMQPTITYTSEANIYNQQYSIVTSDGSTALIHPSQIQINPITPEEQHMARSQLDTPLMSPHDHHPDLLNQRRHQQQLQQQLEQQQELDQQQQPQQFQQQHVQQIELQQNQIVQHQPMLQQQLQMQQLPPQSQQHQLSSDDQLSPEELEQHLEHRRMEQATLLLPDWDSGVHSEMFGSDSSIKFMAED